MLCSHYVYVFWWGVNTVFRRSHVLECCVALQAFAVMLQHDEKLPDQSEVYLQFALLYSSTSGERRIR